MDEDLEYLDLDILQCYALVGLSPAPVQCYGEVRGVVADDFLLNQECRRVWSNTDGDEFTARSGPVIFYRRSAFEPDDTYPRLSAAKGFSSSSAMVDVLAGVVGENCP